MARSANLSIENCMDCPHHKELSSPPTGDSFDMADTDVVCTLAKGKYDYRGVKGRGIDLSSRWRKREDTEVPKWCPLLEKDKS